MNDVSEYATTPNPPGPPRRSDAGAPSPHDAVGAYVLDALPEGERHEFEEHLTDCPVCRPEVLRLRPVVDLLPRLLELELAGPDADISMPAPSADLGVRLLTVVGGRAGTARTRDADPRRQPTTSRAERPPRRIERSSSRAGRDGGMTFPFSWLAAAALAIVAIGSALWALNLRGDLDARRTEVDSLQAQISELRTAANATAYTLVPTGEGPTTARGTLFLAPGTGAGTMQVFGLPELEEGRAYQLWFLNPEADPVPGNLFRLNDEGVGYLTVPADVPAFQQVGLTNEPASGSTAPTTPVLMLGTIGGAFG